MKPSELLDSPEKWVQGCYALDNRDQNVDPRSPSACKWCLIGSLVYCFQDWRASRVALSCALPNTNLQQWNDDPATTFKDVRSLLLKAGL